MNAASSILVDKTSKEVVEHNIQHSAEIEQGTLPAWEQSQRAKSEEEQSKGRVSRAAAAAQILSQFSPILLERYYDYEGSCNAWEKGMRTSFDRTSFLVLEKELDSEAPKITIELTGSVPHKWKITLDNPMGRAGRKKHWVLSNNNPMHKVALELEPMVLERVAKRKQAKEIWDKERIRRKQTEEWLAQHSEMLKSLGLNSGSIADTDGQGRYTAKILFTGTTEQWELLSNAIKSIIGK